MMEVIRESTLIKYVIQLVIIRGSNQVNNKFWALIKLEFVTRIKNN